MGSFLSRPVSLAPHSSPLLLPTSFPGPVICGNCAECCHAGAGADGGGVKQHRLFFGSHKTENLVSF